ncbi:hypothetical protein [Streptomyces canus]
MDADTVQYGDLGRLVRDVRDQRPAPREAGAGRGWAYGIQDRRLGLSG